MTAVAWGHVGVQVRAAEADDNDALVALAAACPMAGDITMCVERAPDFFALSQLEGSACRVGVAEEDGRVIGCALASERRAFVDGHAIPTAYAGDLKVHPTNRGGPAADALVEFMRGACRELGGDDVPILATVLAGNATVERRTAGVRGMPHLTQVATLDVHAVPFLWDRSTTVSGVRVADARDADLAEMGELCARIGPTRQFAPQLDADALAGWLRRAPGLDISDYLVARRADGRMAGFVGFWQQASFKQLRVLGYSPRLAIARGVVNAVAPLVGGATLPAAGHLLSSVAALHLHVRADEPEVLRAILLHAYRKLRGTGATCFTIALDRRDPLRRALAGLLPQPTVVGVFVTTPRGRWSGATLDSRPLYFDSALV